MATAPRRLPAARNAQAQARPASNRPAGPASRPSPARRTAPTSNSLRGDSALEAARAELDRQDAEREARKNQPLAPFRYFTKVGETSEVVIVDDRPVFFRREHALRDRRSGKYDVFVPCIDDRCACPACQVSERESYFAMYLTVIDFTGYENQHGDWVEFSKKLLVVKPTQQKKIMRYYDRHGTLRGMRLEMTRSGNKDAAIGDPEFIDFLDEDTLEGYVFTYTDKEGQEHEVLCYEPYDYEELMPDMDEDELRTLVGGDAPAGSRRADDRSLGRTRGRGNQQDDDQDDGWNGSSRRVASRRGPSAPSRGAQQDEQDYQDDDGAQDAAPPTRRPTPARGAPARGAAPARSAAPARTARTTRTAAPELDPDDNPEAGSDAPWQGDAPQRSARPAAPRRSARPAPEPEEAPARAAPANVAARRANLRRGG